MLLSLCYLVLAGLLNNVAAIPVITKNLNRLHRRECNSSVEPFSLPESDNEPIARAQAIEIKRQTFLYGPSPAGRPFFPTGSLGNATVQKDEVQDAPVWAEVEQKVAVDEAYAIAAIKQAGGIKSLADYNLLYKGQWTQSISEGLDPGMLSNYTQDLLFSMERLSIYPFTIKRLRPEDDLSFTVDDAITTKLTGATLERLHSSGHLFYSDHRQQENLPRTARYAAACDAYFYVHPINGDFLPLAIRPNVGSDLIYTPLDKAEDWLLAKIMFNVNDFWYTNWYHFSATHEVIEIVYEAAMRTLSDDHPVFAIIDRIAYRIFAFTVDAITKLVNPGGPIDTLFPFPGLAVVQYTKALYDSGGAGAFQANYFHTNFASRGLSNCSFGPELKHFPFFEDASVIHSHLTTFMTTFVNSYYPSDFELARDNELQAWIAEAVPAEIIDFPPAPLTTRETLVEILTHLAYLGTAVHHTLNSNALAESLSTLPFHPASLYAPVPTAKGVSDILPWLPPAEEAIGQIALTASFNRRTFAHTNKTLAYMFDEPTLLKRMNDATGKAAKEFRHAMKKVSRRVSERTFDREGLSQGMPFVWKSLDPEVAPFYVAI